MSKTNTIIGGPPSQERPEQETEASLRTVEELPGSTDSAVHRTRLYSLLALGFERPGADFDAAVEADAFAGDLMESAMALDKPIGETALPVGERVTTADELHGDWASLFGVEEGISVSPYELTYLPGPLMTTVRKLADIGGFYDAFGLSVAEGMNDRRDHICFLLEFLGHLAMREAALREAGDAKGVAVVVDAQRQFLEDHLGRWYWRFADEVSQRDDGFYAVLAELLAALVAYELDRLDLEPDWVPDDPAVTEWNEGIFGDEGRSCGGCGMTQDGIETGTEAMQDMDTLGAMKDVDERTG